MTVDSRSAENGVFELISKSQSSVYSESSVQINNGRFYLKQTVCELLELLLQQVEKNVFATTVENKNNQPKLPSTSAVFKCGVSINDTCSGNIISNERPKKQVEDVYKYFRLLSGRVVENNTSARQATKRKKTVVDQPKYSSGDMPDLEPGEVPDPNYVPPPSVVDSSRTVYCQVYPCDSSLMEVPFHLFNYVTRETLEDTLYNENFIPASFEDGLEDDTPAPADFLQPSKTIEHLFEAAKQRAELLQRCGLSSLRQSDESSRATVFPSFPNTGGRDERKCKQYKRNKEYKIRFTNNLGALRHHRSRWIKGGRLTTTGKFEEIDSSEDKNEQSKPVLLADGTIYLEEKNVTDSDAGKMVNVEASISEVKALSEGIVVQPPPKRKFPTHIIYEDTHQYPEYLKYYAELHANQYPGAYDDEQNAWQRRWFQYYCHAVQFVDIPDEFKNEYADNEAKAIAADKKAKQQHFTSLFNVEDLPLAEKLELYYQQWRWKQINQYQDHSRSMPMSLGNSTDLSPALPTWTDGVSVGGEPIMYGTVPQEEAEPKDKSN